MPSPAERARSGMEWALRVLALALLVWCLVLALDVDGAGGPELGDSAALPESLERWTTVVRPTHVHVALEHPPSRTEQEWLAALAGAGTAVEWSGSELLPTAITVEPRADPLGGAGVGVAAPPDAHVVLRDTLGVLDTARADAYGVRVHVARPRATMEAAVGPVVASAARHDSLQLRRLLVLGAAGWETKFVTVALEERGWEVDTHIAVSPETHVRQGGVTAIDTSRYSAVLVLDATAAPYADRVARYVRSGGGLILWSPAATLRGLAPLAPGMQGERIDDEGRAPRDAAPRDDLALVPVVSPRPDAVALERRGDVVALAARRVGAGRVIQNGYVNSWRWRMAGGDDAPELHRGWLAGLVARVAYTGRASVLAPPTDPAPVAALIERLGPAVPAPDERESDSRAAHQSWIFALLCTALFLEWLSRRTRGVR